MSGISDSSLRQKLLAISPFPTIKKEVILCRSEESAIRCGAQLGNLKGDRVAGKGSRKSKEICKICGHGAYIDGEACPAASRKCALCKKAGPFVKVCPEYKSSISMVPPGCSIIRWASLHLLMGSIQGVCVPVPHETIDVLVFHLEDVFPIANALCV